MPPPAPLTTGLPPAELVAHAAFVRRLAFHLLRNDADADDAAQETIARALSRPPREGPGLRSWLATVLKNVVRMGARGEKRRAMRERETAKPAGTGPGDEVVARQEILRRVVAAVERLDRDHREVVLLRHYEGLAPREIAARIGVPVATVKSRLARAHERLRRALDEGAGGNVEGWRGALGAFAGFDLARVAAKPVTGVVAMGTAAKVGTSVAVVAILGVGAWLVAGGARGPAGVPPTDAAGKDPEEAPGLATARPPDGARAATRAEGEGTSTTPRAAPPAEEASPEFVRRLETEVAPGRVEGVVLRGKEPLGGGRAILRVENLAAFFDPEFVPGEPVGSAVIGPDGAFSVADVSPGLYTLELALADGAALFASVAVPAKRIVAALGTRVVRGRVFDRAGRPAARVAMLVQSSPKRPKAGTEFAARGRTDDEGYYEIRGLPSGPYLVSAYLVLSRGGADRRDAEADGSPDGVTTVDLGTDRPEPTWSGVVRCLDGKPLAGPSQMWLNAPGASPYIGVHVAIDAEGRFSTAVPAGTYSVTVNVRGRAHSGGPVVAPRVTIEADLVADVVIPGARLRGVVRRTGTGEPLPGTAGRGETVFLTPEGKGPEARLGIALGPDGAFLTAGILPGRYKVTGWPTPLGDTSGRPMTVEVREGEAEAALELWTTR